MPDRGFTLVETLVVLVILGLVVGLVVARGPSRSPGFTLRSEAETIDTALGEARGRAIATDRDVAIGLSADPPGLAIEGRPPVAISPSLRLAMLTGDGKVSRANARFHFRPDGSADGGGVLVANDAGRIAISVAWLTGRITVATMAAP